MVKMLLDSDPDPKDVHPPLDDADHARPVAAVESAVSTWPFVPTASRANASAPVPAIKSPLASMAVAIEFVTVTVPEVPPPDIPVPAVTPVMSP